MTERQQSDGRKEAWRLWKGPTLAWFALVALAALSLGAAYMPLGGANPTVHLAIAAIMIAVLAIFLMDLQNAKTLIRIVALAGLFWSILMFALTFNDYLSRSY